VQPTSPGQFAASTSFVNGPDGHLPAPEQVTADTWAIALPLPHGGTVPYTLCYVLLDENGEAHLVDPGYGTDENEALLRQGLAVLGTPVIRSVIVTHLHPDHLGMADRIRTATGAKVVMHSREQKAIETVRHAVESLDDLFERWQVPAGSAPVVPSGRTVSIPLDSRPADALLADGDLLDIPGREITAILTPGHTPGHLCLRDAAQSLLFTGDHVLPTVYPGLGLGGPTDSNPIADYLDSIDRIRPFDDHEILPGHGYRFTGLGERCDRIVAHHLKRSREVAAALAEFPDASVWETASRIRWTAGWQNLAGFNRYSALAQTEMHIGYLEGVKESQEVT
jgi:glyoxylase-like metal-dependent hydrolase (beta-lactamase superfamily II)